MKADAGMGRRDRGSLKLLERRELRDNYLRIIG